MNYTRVKRSISINSQINPDDPPVPGGKVFVTVVQCVSCNKNVLLKNHNHIRCQMLYSLPMDRVKNYKPM
ncbi:hypothetical protein DPMN_058470 [Dreissena polymorpha]|uniref:Uncharacterized protein n=1 Tax=Dreissena polymorpha TaxID=45954 RepID=A0A9D4HDQ4_DREPO|nr:hypothetical protein DPMN_058470 [Dreissena polymorpha]